MEEKNILLSKDDFNNIYATSCIENYILAFLSKTEEISYLYYASLLSLQAVFKDFLVEQVSYAAYPIGPYIHHLARQIGSLSYEEKIETVFKILFQINIF